MGSAKLVVNHSRTSGENRSSEAIGEGSGTATAAAFGTVVLAAFGMAVRDTFGAALRATFGTAVRDTFGAAVRGALGRAVPGAVDSCCCATPSLCLLPPTAGASGLSDQWAPATADLEQRSRRANTLARDNSNSPSGSSSCPTAAASADTARLP